MEKGSGTALHPHAVCLNSCPLSGRGRKWGCGLRKVDLGIAGKARSREKLLGKEVRGFGDSMSQAWRENLDKIR